MVFVVGVIKNYYNIVKKIAQRYKKVSTLQLLFYRFKYNSHAWPAKKRPKSLKTAPRCVNELLTSTEKCAGNGLVVLHFFVYLHRISEHYCGNGSSWWRKSLCNSGFDVFNYN